MSEIKRDPIFIRVDVGDVDKNKLYMAFDDDHTFSDVARWIIHEGGKEEVVNFLTEGQDLL